VSMAYAIERDGTVSTVPPPMQLFLLSEGVTIQAALTLAANLGIADLLAEGPKTSEALAIETSTHPPSLYRVLRLLSSFGVFSEIDPGLFAQTATSELLRTDTPASMRSWVRMTGLPVWSETFAEALRSIKTGEPVLSQVVGSEFFEYLSAHPHDGALFNAAMGDFGRGIAEAVIHAYDFSGVGTIVDVGGGHGTLLSAILRSNAHLRGILFDLPHVADGARALMASAGLADRCEVRRQPDSERGLRVGTEEQARQRDANLAGPDVPVTRRGRLQHRKQPGGEGVAVRGHLLDAGAADADGRKFRRDVHGVDQDQGRADQDGDQSQGLNYLARQVLVPP